MKPKEIPIGTEFGRWTVEGPGEPNLDGRGWYRATSKCRCACGTVKDLDNAYLRHHRPQSCGCHSTEMVTRHGCASDHKHTPEYCAWAAIKRRCTNKNRKDYHRYGGRGIKRCARWDVFENFLADMGLRPSPEHSLDRYPNPDGDYEPGNCRWATDEEQNNNMSTNHKLTFYGVTLSLTAWSRISQVNQTTISHRLRRGMSEKEAVWTPVKKGQRKKAASK